MMEEVGRENEESERMHAACGGRKEGRGNTSRSTSKGIKGNRSVSDGSGGWKGRQQQLFAAVVLLAPFIGVVQSEGTFVLPPSPSTLQL
jgi:hypothetical protein